MNVFEFIQDTVQNLIEAFEEDNLLYGTLTRTVVEEDYVPKDDGTGLSPIEVTAKIIACLSNVMEFQFAVNDILRNLRFKVPIDYEKKYRFLQEADSFRFQIFRIYPHLSMHSVHWQSIICFC